jgi:hypothetical protein
MSEAERTPETRIDDLVRGYLEDQAETVDAQVIYSGVQARLFLANSPAGRAGCCFLSRLATRCRVALGRLLKSVARGVTVSSGFLRRPKSDARRVRPRNEGG